MDPKTDAGKLIKVTEYGKRLPLPAAPSRLKVKDEMRRMQTETDNLNAAEKVEPNPLYKNKKRSKTSASITTEDIKNMTQEELDELLKSFVNAGDSELDVIKNMTKPNPQEEAMSGILEKFAATLATPKFGSVQTPGYRFPGYFNA